MPVKRRIGSHATVQPVIHVRTKSHNSSGATSGIKNHITADAGENNKRNGGGKRAGQTSSQTLIKSQDRSKKKSS